MPTTYDVAKKALLEAFLTYTDWVGDDVDPYDLVNVPFAVTIGTKLKGDPFAPGNTARVLPLLVVQGTGPTPGREYGLQQELTWLVRMSIIRQAAVGEDPAEQLEALTGKIASNILATKRVLTAREWLGLDWVCRMPVCAKHPPDNDLHKWLSSEATDSAGTGLPYSASVTDFTVLSFSVPDDVPEEEP